MIKTHQVLEISLASGAKVAGALLADDSGYHWIFSSAKGGKSTRLQLSHEAVAAMGNIVKELNEPSEAA